MINRTTKEYVDNGVAYNVTTLYFCGVLVYKCTSSTTNTAIISQLKTEKHNIIKGFNNENKSKTNKGRNRAS